MVVVPFSKLSGVRISEQMYERIEQLHDAGVLAGGVQAEAADSEALYQSLIRVGRAELEVRGLASGHVFIRWDGAWRSSRCEPYSHPPEVRGLPD